MFYESTMAYYLIVNHLTYKSHITCLQLFLLDSHTSFARFMYFEELRALFLFYFRTETLEWIVWIKFRGLPWIFKINNSIGERQATMSPIISRRNLIGTKTLNKGVSGEQYSPCPTLRYKSVEFQPFDKVYLRDRLREFRP